MHNPAVWTLEKSASIDWSNVTEVLAREFSLSQLLAMHPALGDHVANVDVTVYKHYQQAFAIASLVEERKLLLQQWLNQSLFRLRDSRWCHLCHAEGHTFSSCTAIRPSKASSSSLSRKASDKSTGVGADRPEAPSGIPSNVLEKHLQHQRDLECRRLVQEKLKQKSNENSSAIGRDRAAQANLRRQRDAATVEQFAQEERPQEGVVRDLDKEHGIGLIKPTDMEMVRFFLDRADYGIREIHVEDRVEFRLDLARDHPIACDVRPRDPKLTHDDVRAFLQHCKVAVYPIKVIEKLLSQQTQWQFVVHYLHELAPKSVPEFCDCVHIIVEFVTFMDNYEAVHLPIMQSFLALLASESPATSRSAGDAFFPDYVGRVVEHEGRETAVTEMLLQTDPIRIEQWMEVANLVLLFRQHLPTVPEELIRSRIVDPMCGLLQRCDVAPDSALSPLSHRKLKIAITKLNMTGGYAGVPLIPTAAELSVPVTDVSSVFNPASLPILEKPCMASVEDYMGMHCRLLRADVFEATARLLVSLCYQLPNMETSPETASDIQYARLFDQVKFLGRVITRDRDFSSPNSYIFHVTPKTEMAKSLSCLKQGTTVCITTGQDRSVIEQQEIFWGIVSSCDQLFVRAGVVVITPCKESDFDLLVSQLLRNDEAGATDKSMLLETMIFMAGYRGVAQALNAFLGPSGMTLPLSHAIVGSINSVPASTANATPINKNVVGYIPPHCRDAFRSLVRDIENRFLLDPGQAKAMRTIATSEVMLVQGPPGTGKSFIGCRIVEVLVRYKQLVSSGGILSQLDIDQLPTTHMDKVLPRLGPIVVITFKNHALDEFLVDLLRSRLWQESGEKAGSLVNPSGKANTDVFPHGRRIVRIGARSREPDLELYTLGTLMQGQTKSITETFRHRIWSANRQLMQVARGIHLLLEGKHVENVLETWMTKNQRQSFLSRQHVPEWLRGERFLSPNAQDPQPPERHYTCLLKTQLAQIVVMSSTVQLQPEAPSLPIAAEADAKLSVFQEMRKEVEYREYNDLLHKVYIPREALLLAEMGTELPLPAGIPADFLSLWNLSWEQRHAYIAYLIQKQVAAYTRRAVKLMEVLCNLVTLRNHKMDEARLQLLEGADVIGLTTTGCALNQNLLRSLRPSILVVEEAAEVLESQLLACMTDSLQQLVLIGDHYQLQPKVETFLYEKVNHMNVSLFQRLTRHIPLIRLVEQRRMHPVLSQLIRPFYGKKHNALTDHSSLNTRPFIDISGVGYTDRIPGLAERLWFWKHNHPESDPLGGRSKVNTHEIDMAVGIVTHLLTNATVMAKSITIITPYLGQSGALSKALKGKGFRDVHVSTVDLFQGDENDIIVLSLVRTLKLTEFIRMRNRMIVSCSRARFAFIILGNDELLRQCGHWAELLKMLEERECIATYLPIVFDLDPSRSVVKVSDPCQWPTAPEST